MNHYGASFTLNGEDVTDSLALGAAVTVDDHNSSLVGVFADGSMIELDLTDDAKTAIASGKDYIDDDSILRITRIQPGDFDDDGYVNGGDISTWQNALGSRVELPYAGADGNGDMVVDGADFLIWQRRHGSSVPYAAAAAVTETRSLTLTAISIAAIAWRNRRSYW